MHRWNENKTKKCERAKFSIDLRDSRGISNKRNILCANIFLRILNIQHRQRSAFDRDCIVWHVFLRNIVNNTVVRRPSKFLIEPKSVVYKWHLENKRASRSRYLVVKTPNLVTYKENKHYDTKHRRMLCLPMWSLNHIWHNAFVENEFHDKHRINSRCWKDRTAKWWPFGNQHKKNIQARLTKSLSLFSLSSNKTQTWYCFPSNSVIPEWAEKHT